LRRFFSAFTSIFVAFLLFSCDLSIDSGEPRDSKSESFNFYNDSIKIDFENFEYVDVTLNELNSNDVFVVKINKSKRVIPVENVGAVSIIGQSSVAASVASGSIIANAASGEARSALLPQVSTCGPYLEWNSNPPPVEAELINGPRQVQRQIINGPDLSASFSATAQLSEDIVGSRTNFWVQNMADAWIQVEAELKAMGTHSKIWVCNNLVAPSVAKEIATRFDSIYSYETSLIGYEYGGGPGGNGGVDGDSRIQILIYDIPEWNIAGYFWGKDFYSQSTLDKTNNRPPRTNNGEIFYLDYVFASGENRKILYSTMVHELQHMINFNSKTIRHGLSAGTWYNEMLSMVTEDTISPLIGISFNTTGHPSVMRLPVFLNYFAASGVADWDAGDIVLSYANCYAFGAYLARNFGGAKLLQNMVTNAEVDEPSISQAMSAAGFGGGFDFALSKYGEAFIFNDIFRHTFNKTVTQNIGGQNYQFKKLDILAMSSEKGAGPNYGDIDTRQELRPRGITTQTSSALHNITGDVTLRLENPLDREKLANKNVEVYIYVK
jgi:hypothetical protein